MIEERRWPLGNKVTELYSAVERGSISSIKWKDTLIAWCNSESQVQIHICTCICATQCTYIYVKSISTVHMYVHVCWEHTCTYSALRQLYEIRVWDKQQCIALADTYKKMYFI